MHLTAVLGHILKYGFHGIYLLVFSVLIWALFSAILIANPKNKINLWGFIAGLFFGLGAFKEYLFYELAPILIADGLWTAAGSEFTYSILSALFYDFTMPSAMIFSLYFCHAERYVPNFFPKHSYLCYAPALVLLICFPASKTLQLQHLPVFCLSVAGYGWLFGILITVNLLYTLHQERLSARYRQLYLAVVSILPPVWCWLILAFPYHALGITFLDKAWQLNLPVIFLALCFLTYQAFKGGIWGIRIKRENYDWNSGYKTMKKNSHFLSHALKNDLSKIDWCISLLEGQGVDSRELEIIRNSAKHLQRFFNSAPLDTDTLQLEFTQCDIHALFQRIQSSFLTQADQNIQLEVTTCDPRPLLCDETHLEEALGNLVNNAAEAIESDGHIRLSYICSPTQKQAVISVSDTGCGIADSDIHKLSDAFFTTKKTTENMGLGLFYCWNIMEAHGGHLELQSEPGVGSTFSLVFPLKNRPKIIQHKE